MVFSVTILGSNAALPVSGRNPTSQIVNYNDKLYLLDCGEGTQARFSENGIKPGKIEHIFISHMHGDHYFGLVGLLSSYQLYGRTKPLHIYAPKELKAIIDIQLAAYHHDYTFPLHFHPIKPENGKIIHEEEHLRVRSLEMKHGIPCSGFLFEEHSLPGHIIPEKIKEHKIPYAEIPKIKAGADFTKGDGTRIPNRELTAPPQKERSYAFCTDTTYNESLVPHIQSVDMIYHDATFKSDHDNHATDKDHSTATQAATIAKMAGAGKLLLGHFSSRYQNDDLQLLLEQAQAVFPNSALALEGCTFRM